MSGNVLDKARLYVESGCFDLAQLSLEEEIRQLKDNNITVDLFIVNTRRLSNKKFNETSPDIGGLVFPPIEELLISITNNIFSVALGIVIEKTLEKIISTFKKSCPPTPQQPKIEIKKAENEVVLKLYGAPNEDTYKIIKSFIETYLEDAD